MKLTIDVNLNVRGQQENEIINLLKTIINQNNNTMSKISDIEAQVDTLQQKLDAEQEEIKVAIDGFKATIQELRDQIAAGGSDAEALDRIAQKLTDLTTDLESTVTPEAPPTPEG